MALADFLETPLYTYAKVRSLGFAAEYACLNSLSRLIPHAEPPVATQDPEVIRFIRQDLFRLLRTDIHHIRQGLYPARVLKPESLARHLARLPRLIWDGIAINRRRRQGRTTAFHPEARDYLDELPRYYRRNFHFQTDGYLSQRSAELYEHQVELLFGGSADAMRRMIIPPMKMALNADGKGLKFLEIGAGTGRASRFVRLAFPRAKLVVSDLSDPYLKQAERRLADLPRVDFLQADGARLPFQDGFFDAVYSVFLFHELPLAERVAVIREARRVLKPGGFFGMVDSIQTGDEETYDPILRTFPRNYHEPFYRNYLAHPMPAILDREGFAPARVERGFFSKVCWGTLSGSLFARARLRQRRDL